MLVFNFLNGAAQQPPESEKFGYCIQPGSLLNILVDMFEYPLRAFIKQHLFFGIQVIKNAPVQLVLVGGWHHGPYFGVSSFQYPKVAIPLANKNYDVINWKNSE